MVMLWTVYLERGLQREIVHSLCSEVLTDFMMITATPEGSDRGLVFFFPSLFTAKFTVYTSGFANSLFYFVKFLAFEDPLNCFMLLSTLPFYMF